MERFEKQLRAITIFAGYNYFRNIKISYPLVHEINMIFLRSSNFLSNFHFKNYGGRAREAGDRVFSYTSSKFYSHITY